MANQQHDYWSERELQLMRYRLMAEETTDLLAARFLLGIIEELEAELKQADCRDRI